MCARRRRAAEEKNKAANSIAHDAVKIAIPITAVRSAWARRLLAGTLGVAAAGSVALAVGLAALIRLWPLQVARRRPPETALRFAKSSPVPGVAAPADYPVRAGRATPWG